jgi:predicted nucleotide-binding protein with TIR-like domain
MAKQPSSKIPANPAPAKKKPALPAVAKPAAPTMKKAATPDPSAKRVYLKQSDVPAAGLEEALRVPEAILEHYAGRPTSPLHLAKALNVDPKGSQLKVLTGAAMAFGLTDGGAQATAISVSDLAKRILRPKTEDAPQLAKREAILTPRVFREFLSTYNGHSFPRPDIAINVLEEMGVPRPKAAEVLERIEASAKAVGFIEQIRNKSYVSLQSDLGDIAASSGEPNAEEDRDVAADSDQLVTKRPVGQQPLNDNGGPEEEFVPPHNLPRASGTSSTMATAIADDARRRRVFITHGRNRDLVEPIRKLLEYGELTPVVSVDKQSVSKPVPEKVMDDMRSCGAAIIHVDADRKITEAGGEEHVLLNPNVLIEIGAAMAFYGRRFILLVRDGVKLPSNLQGLYEVRYTDDTLDAAAAIKLLEAIKDIKNYALPTDPSDE